MTTVLVAGGTGMLGSRIADYLVKETGVQVRLLVRDGWEDDDAKRQRVDPLVTQGATIAIGDVTSPESLAAATEGVDVVVSALAGQDDVMVEGQIAIAEAAAHAGARRFIPSDFAIDLFHAPSGPPQFDVRLQADAAIDALDLEVIHILNGGFMDQMLSPGFRQFVDVPAGVVRFWGTGDEPFDLTTVDDTARFTAKVATDDTAAPGVHAISGAQVTFNGIARELEGVTGTTLKTESFGDAEQLRKVIAEKGDAWNAVNEWYLLAMLSTPVLVPENDRYPDARPTDLHTHLHASYGSAHTN
jgi:uncharacterized protein YbjT (DUF2867 family)